MLIKNEIDKVWLACAIDTDGCISLNRFFRHGHYNYRVIVAFEAEKYPILTEHFASLIGKEIVKKKTKHHCQHWVYLTRQEKTFELLTDLEPYLMAKRKQAQVCLSALTILIRNKWKRVLGDPIGVYYNLMKELNRDGRPHG